VPRAARTLEFASQGLSLSRCEILVRRVLAVNLCMVGTPEQAADRMKEWVEAGVRDGFTVVVDDLHDGPNTFVDQVVPILRRRGLRPENSLGATLRDHLGLAEQLGLDLRSARDK
jgi:hypothetical protein